MTLRVTARFWGRTYTGATQRGGQARPEWPPSPHRLVAALLSGAHQQQDPDDVDLARRALEGIVRAGHPVIHAPQAREHHVPAIYTPATGEVAGNKQFTGQGPALRAMGPLAPQVRMLLAGTDVAFDIDVELSDPEIQALDRAARSVPYLGRSTHPVELSVSVIEHGAAGPADTVRMQPVKQGGKSVRGWVPETIEQLDQAHAAYLGYLPAGPQAQRGCQVRYQAFEGPVPCEGLEIVPLRSSEGRHQEIWEVLDAVRSGLSDNGLDHVTAFPLVQVGKRRGGGECSGIGLYSSDDAPATRSAAGLVEAILGERAAERSRPTWVLQPERWAKASAEWVSATPMPLHPDERVAHAMAAEAFTQATGVEPLQIRLSASPHLVGSSRWSGAVSGGLRPWYLQITAPTEVAGPITLSNTLQNPCLGVLAPAL